MTKHKSLMLNLKGSLMINSYFIIKQSCNHITRSRDNDLGTNEQL